MHKSKKKRNKKIIKESLCILGVFFLIIVTYFDQIKDKDKISLLSVTKNTIFTNVTQKELLNILNKNTGIILLINDKKTSNRIINLLYKNNIKENIYIYNLKNDEMILETNDNNEIIEKQKQSDFYNKILTYLGSYSEEYKLTNKNGETINTNFKKIYTPMVLFIKEGKILLSHYITEEEIEDEELLDIYKQGYNMIKN